MMAEQEGNLFEESVTSARRIADPPDAKVTPGLQGSGLVQNTPAPRRMKFSIGVRLGVMLAAFLLFLPACSSQSDNPIQGPLSLLVQGLSILWILLTFTIVFKLLDGTINMRGLLLDKDTDTFSPARLQLLIFTLIIASTYVGSNDMAEKSSEELLELMNGLMGGTTLVYLGAKRWPILKKNRT